MLTGAVQRGLRRISTKQAERGDEGLRYFECLPASVEAELQWGPDYLSQFCKYLLRKLQRSSVGPVIDLLRSQPIVWASGCSGSDSPAWIFDGISACIGGGKFQHIYSAEIDPRKRAWIKEMTKCTHLFSDVFDLTRSKARCDRSGRVVDMKLVHSRVLDILLIGFSCTSASRLNRTFEGDVDDIGCQTGATLWAALLVIGQRRPRTFIAENVMGLCDDNMHLRIKQKFEGLGYVVFLWEVCATQASLPQARWRLYFLGFEQSLVAKVPDFTTLIHSTYALFMKSNPLTPLDAFLAPECVEVSDGEDEDEEPLRKRTRCGGKWKEKHTRMFSDARVHPSRTHWTELLSSLYPSYKNLPERTKQLLDLAGIQFPHPAPTCVSIDQTDVGVHTNVAPTITPSGVVWLGHRCRLMSGIEKLALQGIFVPSEATQRWGNSLLADMAGNAFCACNCMVFCLLALIGLGAAENARKHDSACSYAFDPAASESSSESEEQPRDQR